jgi:hypothetical protein
MSIPLDEWRLVLTALCAGSPAWVGTLHEPDTWTLVHPTNFGWLRSMQWLPGLALLDLAEPGTIPAAEWEPLCGPLEEAPATTEGRFLIGRFPVPETGRSARLSLITDTAGLVRTVRVVIE